MNMRPMVPFPALSFLKLVDPRAPLSILALPQPKLNDIQLCLLLLSSYLLQLIILEIFIANILYILSAHFSNSSATSQVRILLWQSIHFKSTNLEYKNRRDKSAYILVIIAYNLRAGLLIPILRRFIELTAQLKFLVD